MRVVVAMSGGVDSSVAAALLAEQGHDVIGLSMQLYDHSGEMTFGSCCSIDDLHDARRVAAAINIPHYIVNFEKQFQETVVSNFVQEYVKHDGHCTILANEVAKAFSQLREWKSSGVRPKGGELQ